MEHTKKRPPPKENSLSLSNKPKPSDSSSSALSASSGDSGPDDDPCKTEQEIVSGENDERKLDSSWGNGDCVSTESSNSVGDEALEEDQSAEGKKDDDNPEDNVTEWNRKPSRTRLWKNYKEVKEESQKSERTEETENAPSKAFTCECGKSYTNNSHLRRHKKTRVCSFPIVVDRRKGRRGRSRTKSNSGWGNGDVSTESSTFVDGETLEDDQSIVCQTIDGDPEENLMEWDHKPSYAGLRKPVKEEDKGANERKPKKTRGRRRTQNQESKPYTCECGKSYTNNSHLRRHRYTRVCNFPLTLVPRKGRRGRRGKRADSGWGSGDGVSAESSTLVDGETLEDDQPIVCEKIDDPEENLTEWNDQPSYVGLRRTVRKDNDADEKNPKKPRGRRQRPSQEEKLFPCACGKSYTNNSHLRRHKRTRVCNFPLVVEPRKAKSTKGRSGKSLLCSCGKGYATSSHLYRHQKTCQDSPMTSEEAEAEEYRLKPYICACGKRYTTSSHLYRHQRSHVDGGGEVEEESAQTFICDCGRVFSSRSNLSRHMKTHTVETFQIEEQGGEPAKEIKTEAPPRKKPHACPCGKRYYSISHLYRHQRTHQEGIVIRSSSSQASRAETETPYKCDCGKSYSSKSHLYRHQRSHKTEELVVDNPDRKNDVQGEDSGEKPFQCECGKSFILWFSLMLHKRVHCKATSSSAPDT